MSAFWTFRGSVLSVHTCGHGGIAVTIDLAFKFWRSELRHVFELRDYSCAVYMYVQLTLLHTATICDRNFHIKTASSNRQSARQTHSWRYLLPDLRIKPSDPSTSAHCSLYDATLHTTADNNLQQQPINSKCRPVYSLSVAASTGARRVGRDIYPHL